MAAAHRSKVALYSPVSARAQPPKVMPSLRAAYDAMSRNQPPSTNRRMFARLGACALQQRNNP